MCGIFMCLVNENGKTEFSSEHFLDILSPSLKNRGPNHTGKECLAIRLNESESVSATFVGCVLWLRGSSMTEQPLTDSDGNILLWNGDVFEGDILNGDNKVSDTKCLSDKLKSLPDHEIHTVRC